MGSFGAARSHFQQDSLIRMATLLYLYIPQYQYMQQRTTSIFANPNLLNFVARSSWLLLLPFYIFKVFVGTELDIILLRHIIKVLFNIKHTSLTQDVE